MKIGSPQIADSGDQLVISYPIESALGAQTLWYSVDQDFGSFIAPTCDAPLVALLITAMATGEDIEVAGPVTERLWANLAGPYQTLLRAVMPALRPVKIHATETAPELSSPAAVATGFSAGVDSYCLLADHHYARQPAGYRVTHLFFNNVGSHGHGGERLFHERLAAIRPVTDRIGLPLIGVNSNLADFRPTQFDFQQTHTPLNASVPLLLQGGIGCFLYASAYSFSELFIGPSDSMAYSDVVALPLLSLPSLQLHSVGSEYTRVEKTLRVATIPTSYDTLDVCVGGEHAGNCSKCWKCLRTLLTLEIAGYLDRYAKAFDLNLYRQHRERYFERVLASNNPFSREIVQFAAERNFAFPLRARLRARFFPQHSKN